MSRDYLKDFMDAVWNPSDVYETAQKKAAREEILRLRKQVAELESICDMAGLVTPNKFRRLQEQMEKESED